MTYLLPPRLAHAPWDEGRGGELTIYLMRLPDGPPVALTGTAALIWSFACAGEPDVAACMAETVGLPVDQIADSVRDYLEDLVNGGLLAKEAHETTRLSP